jgi:hypothetical protein
MFWQIDVKDIGILARPGLAILSPNRYPRAFPLISRKKKRAFPLMMQRTWEFGRGSLHIEPNLLLSRNIKNLLLSERCASILFGEDLPIQISSTKTIVMEEKK